MLIIYSKRKRPFRDHEDANSSNKRQRASNASAMVELAKSVGALVAAVTKAPLLSTPRHSCPLNLEISPVRRDRAFRRIVEQEALTPRCIARARVIFRGRTELADEYLSFGDGEDEVNACHKWLTMELDAVLLLSNRR